MVHEDELLDLVNAQDEIIGTIWRSEMDRLEAEDLGYIRAVDMFIQNDRGEIWVPKRTPFKTIAPNGLDYSVGGHVSSGETYEEAMLKEMSEEINVDANVDELELLAKIGPNEHRYIRHIYRYRMNEDPNYNPDDFVSAEWMSVDGLIAILKSGIPAKGSILSTIEHCYEQLT